MKKFWFQMVALLIVIFGGLYFAVNSKNFQSSPQTPVQTPIGEKRLQISGKAQLNIEVADTKEERSKGLGGRESLASDSGMLFIFDTADKYRFWMKGVSIPLDFIWISGDRIVDILVNIQPPGKDQPDESLPHYAPVVVVDKVLEVNAGFVENYNIRVGDKIEFTEGL